MSTRRGRIFLYVSLFLLAAAGYVAAVSLGVLAMRYFGW